MSNHLIVEDNNVVKFNLLMLPIAIIICVVVGAGMAYIGYNFFSLIIAFPIIMGLAGGFMAQKVISRTDGERSWWATLLGIVLALLVYGVYRYGEYYLTFQDYGTQIKAIATFRNYLDWSAAQGFSISRTGSSSSNSGVDIEGQGVWIFWGVEILIMLFMAFSSSHEASQEKDSEEVQQIDQS